MNTIGLSMQLTKRRKKNASDGKRDLNLDLKYSTKVENLLHEGKNSSLASDCLYSCVVDQESVDDGVTVLNSPCAFQKGKDHKMASGRQSGTTSTSAIASTSIPQTAVHCPICTNPLFQPSTTTCGHIFCMRCIKAFIRDQKKCPTCAKKLKVTDVHLIYLPARSSN